MTRPTVWDATSTPWVPPQQADGDRYDVVVAGAGVVGLSAAVELAARGRSVLVVEALDAVGQGTTARSTGKLSLLQGTRLSSIERSHGPTVAQGYLDTCRAGLAWAERLLDAWDVTTQRELAGTWAAKESQVSAVRAEDAAARRAGLATRWVREVPGGVPGHGAVVLDDQVQVDPLQYTTALAREAHQQGVAFRLGHRIDGARRDGDGTGVVVTSSQGLHVRADHLVVATGLPVLDRSISFATAKAHRSYSLAFEHPGFEPMLVTAGSPSVSLRGAVGPDRPVVLVGGQGHPVGRSQPAERHVETLRQWAHEHLDVGRELAAWSAQDYMSPDSVPLAGRVPGPAPVHAVTGFGKWGLVAGVQTARRLAVALVGGEDVPLLPPPGRLGQPRTIATVAWWNTEVGAHLASGWAGAMARSTPSPAEGQGVVSRGGPPVATSTVDGCERSVSAVCPHLGGIVRWNDLEQSWDCPLHGSRFGPDGRVLEGPASRGLAPRRTTVDAPTASTTTGDDA